MNPLIALVLVLLLQDAGKKVTLVMKKDGREIVGEFVEKTAEVYRIKVQGVVIDVSIAEVKEIIDGEIKKPEPIMEFTVDRSMLMLAYAPDGKHLIGITPRAVLLLDPDTGKEKCSYAVESNGTMAFHPEGKRLAVAGKDGSVVLLEIATGKKEALSGALANVLSIAFSGDGKFLAAGTATIPDLKSGSVAVWSLSDGKLARTIMGGRHSEVRAVCFSPGDKSLVACVDGLMTWDAATWKETGPIGPTKGIQFHQIVYSKDGTKLYIAPADALHSLELPEGKWGRLKAGTRRSFTYLESRNLAITLAGNDWIRITDLGTEKAILAINAPAETFSREVLAVPASPDGKRFASLEKEKKPGEAQGCKIRIWDIEKLLK